MADTPKSKPPLQRVVDTYHGVPCDTVRPLDAPNRPGEVCGEIHTQCRGHVRSRADHRIHALGDPCSRRARVDSCLCPKHGPNPSAQISARRRVAMDRAQGEIGKLLEQARLAVAGRSTVESIAALREHCAAMVEAAAGLVGNLDDSADDGDGIVGPTGAHGALKANPLVQLWGEWIDRQARIDKIAVDVDLDGRRLQLEEANAVGLLAIMKAGFVEFGMTWNDEVESWMAGQFRRREVIEASGVDWDLEYGDGDDVDDDDEDPPPLAAEVLEPEPQPPAPATEAETGGDDGLADTLFGGAT